VFLITPLLIRISLSLGVADSPGLRKLHKEPMPSMGGIGVFLGMWIPLLLLSFWDNDITARMATKWLTLINIFLAGLAMLLVGIYDDKYGLSAGWKFSVQLLVAVLLVFNGLYFSAITIPFYGPVSLGIVGPLLTIVWIVGITNAFNLIDGIDGLAAGVTFFVAIVTAVIAIVNGNELMALTMCSLGGACLGFLRYNYNPSRIFLGDTGSLFIGMTLATTSVASNFKGTLAASMIAPVMLLGYPIFETLLSMAHRKMRGKPVYTPDNSHIHHRLIEKGLTHNRATLILYGFCLMFCIVAMLTVFHNKMVVGIGILCLFVVIYFGARSLGYIDVFTDARVSHERPFFRLAYLIVEMTKIKIRLAQKEEDLWDIVRETCEELEMDSLEIDLNGNSDNRSNVMYFPLNRKKSSVIVGPVSRNPSPAKNSAKNIEFTLKELDATISVKYFPAEISRELEAELPRLLVEVLKTIDERSKELHYQNTRDKSIKPKRKFIAGLLHQLLS